MYFTYILRCADSSLYVGCTNNLEKRLKQHNESKWGAHYTKIRRPVTLVYQETFATLREARQRESEIKGWRREKKLALIENRVVNPEESATKGWRREKKLALIENRVVNPEESATKGWRREKSWHLSSQITRQTRRAGVECTYELNHPTQAVGR